MMQEAQRDRRSALACPPGWRSRSSRRSRDQARIPRSRARAAPRCACCDKARERRNDRVRGIQTGCDRIKGAISYSPPYRSRMSSATSSRRSRRCRPPSALQLGSGGLASWSRTRGHHRWHRMHRCPGGRSGRRHGRRRHLVIEHLEAKPLGLPEFLPRWPGEADFEGSIRRERVEGTVIADGPVRHRMTYRPHGGVRLAGAVSPLRTGTVIASSWGRRLRCPRAFASPPRSST